MFYTKYLADRLAENEKNNVELYIKTVESLASSVDFESDQNLQLMIVEKLNNIPVILEDESGKLQGRNYGESNNIDSTYLEKRKAKILKKGTMPIAGSGYCRFIYYENSRLYTLITYFPLVQVLLLGAFMTMGYIGFSSSRKAEQNRVWAGMAKETAHQLGTPISAIIAWIEHLKESNQNQPEQLEIISELRNDVYRLELIADRFSKIGSQPKLEKINVFDELEKCRTYMQRRASKKIKFDFPSEKLDIYVNINSHLFDWVIENLIRNALDAMEDQGEIKVEVNIEDNNMVNIELSDTGKGIPISKFKTVFNPGYTTKKRGWGLGLSLAKRIVEDYHNGKIFIKQSKKDKGTTFAIKLPKAT